MMDSNGVKLNIDNRKINMGTNLKIAIGIFIFALMVVGSTYAYYTATDSEGGITGNAGEINFLLDVDKMLPNTNGVDDILITNINELASSLNNGCLDEDGDFALCQLYRITLSNNSSDVNTRVSGKVAFDNQNTPNLSWMLVNNYSASTNYTTSSLGNVFNTGSSSFVNFVDSYLLEYGASVTYYMLVWINETVEVQDDEGGYSGTIRFEDANGNGTTAEFGV